jgi:hypothetical protein
VAGVQNEDCLGLRVEGLGVGGRIEGCLRLRVEGLVVGGRIEGCLGGFEDGF